jgi:hypothetical protein
VSDVADTEDVVVRPLDGPEDDEAVRAIFRSTLVLGREVPIPLEGLEVYEGLCLDWYLGPGRSAAALAEGSRGPEGYALICLDPVGFTRWRRRAVARYLRAVGADLVAGRTTGPTRRFHLLRIRDAAGLLGSPGAAAGVEAHVHLNVARSARDGRVAAALRAHADATCRAAGRLMWAGEVNGTVGTRHAALQRVVGPVVARRPNHTLSWLRGEPVERLTVVRRVPPGAAEV